MNRRVFLLLFFFPLSSGTAPCAAEAFFFFPFPSCSPRHDRLRPSQMPVHAPKRGEIGENVFFFFFFFPLLLSVVEISRIPDKEPGPPFFFFSLFSALGARQTSRSVVDLLSSDSGDRFFPFALSSTPGDRQTRGGKMEMLFPFCFSPLTP